jgi:hypothetical protein
MRCYLDQLAQDLEARGEGSLHARFGGLAELTLAMLATDQEKRPTIEEVCERLGKMLVDGKAAPIRVSECPVVEADKV